MREKKRGGEGREFCPCQVLKASTVPAVVTHHLLYVLLEPAVLTSEMQRLQLFQQHFEERIMGLLGALIPDVSKVCFSSTLRSASWACSVL